MFFSAEVIGITTFLTIMVFVLWYFFTKEIFRNNFLDNKLKEMTEEEKNKNEKRSKRQQKIFNELESLNNPIKINFLFQISYVAMFFSILLFIILNIPLFGLLFAIISFFIPEIYIYRKKEARISAFKKQLPDAINQLLACIQAGQTIQQGFELLGKEMDYPASHEFTKISTDLKTSATLKETLDNFYTRNPISDIKLLVTGLVVAEKSSDQVSINTLKTINFTINQRDAQKKSAKSAIMQGKGTAYVLAALPVFIFTALESFMPAYINDFLTLDIGKLAIFTAFLLDLIGFFVARKITSSSNIVKY